jgi:GMP synthase (glutamine-hydrolysing)
MTILVIEHEDEAPIGILGERWQEVGHVLDIRRPYLGDDQPAYLGPEHDALVVLGGYMGANDDAEHGWLTQTKALLADTTRRGEQPVLGICLGHQLLTVAMGGVVGRNPSGRAIGLTPIGLTPSGHADPLLTGTDGHDAIQYNDDGRWAHPGSPVRPLELGGAVPPRGHGRDLLGVVGCHGRAGEQRVCRGAHLALDVDRLRGQILGPDPERQVLNATS